MATITSQQAIQNLDIFLSEDRLITGEWSRRERGRELGCLLFALGNSELHIDSPEKCPGSLMPGWMAYFVFNAFDGAGMKNRDTTARIFRFVLENNAEYSAGEWGQLRVEFLCLQIKHALDAARAANEKNDRWKFVEEAGFKVQVALRSGSEEMLSDAIESADQAVRVAERDEDVTARTRSSSSQVETSGNFLEAARAEKAAARTIRAAANTAGVSEGIAMEATVRASAEACAEAAIWADAGRSGTRVGAAAAEAAFIRQFQNLSILSKAIRS